MGTRHLTIVKLDGKTKVAQYGQWDGYPGGQGKTIAKFLRTVDLDKFIEQVRGLGEWTQEEIDEAYKAAGHDGSEWVNMEVSDKVKEAHPELSRDYGADVLNLIHSGKTTKVVKQEEFKEDTLFCEYWYEIDLNKRTVDVHGRTEAHATFDEWTEKLMDELEARRKEE